VLFGQDSLAQTTAISPIVKENPIY
jgi:hypothetical protein